MILDLREPAGEDLQAQILFVAQSIGTALKDPDLIVQAFNEPEGDFVLSVTICRHPIPMTLDHLRKLLIGFQPLPLQGRAPGRKEAPGPAFLLVVPPLAERLLKQVGGRHPLVSVEQLLEGAAAFEGQRLAARQQRILLPLDELTVLPVQAGVLAFPHRVQSFIEMTQHVELVEHHLSLRGMGSREGRGAKGLPPIPHRQAKARALFRSQPRIEYLHALLRPIAPTTPEDPPPHQVADDEAVRMPLADRTLVDADALGAGGARPAQLRAHVRLVQLLDGLPVQTQFPCDSAQRGRVTPPPDEEGEAFGLEGVVGQPGQLLLLHGPTVRTPHAPDLDLQRDSGIATGESAHPAHLVVGARPQRRPTDPAACFFPRRTSRRRRA